jgi:hypothetical protein
MSVKPIAKGVSAGYLISFGVEQIEYVNPNPEYCRREHRHDR